MKKMLLVIVLMVLPITAWAEDAFNKETQKSVRTGYELYGGYITDLGIDSSGRMYAGTLSPNGIFHSTDSAETWSGPISGTDLGKVNALVISDEPNTAYVLGGISLYKTTDGGVNWMELTGSSGESAGNDYNQSLAYANGWLVAPVRDGSVDISNDEGGSFTNIVIAENSSINGVTGTTDGSMFYILASAESDYETRTLYALATSDLSVTPTTESGNYPWVGVKPTDANFIVIAGSDGARYTTTGAAGTWQTLTTEPVSGEINFVGDRIYLGDKYTDDLGQTLITAEVVINQLAVDPNDNNTIITGSGTGIHLSTDNGETWSSDAKTNGIVGVTVNDIAQSENKTTVWLAAQGGLAKSNNFLSDSPEWDYPIMPDQASSDIDAIWIDPNDGDHLLAGANSIFLSRDGGATWTDISIGVTGSFNDIVSDGDTLYAAFSEQLGTAGTVYSSTDGGETWTDITGLDAPANQLVVLDDGTLVVGVGHEFNDTASQRGIYLYDGSSWTQVENSTDQAIVGLATVGETIYAVGIGSSNGKMLQSTDNGTTWIDITDQGLPSDAYFHSVAAADETTIYAATGRPAGTSYVYKSTDAGETWSKFYTGLVDEEFNAMLYDGLTTGTSVGVQALYSKPTLTLARRSAQLTVKLKDATTSDPLRQRRIKLYQKHTKNGDWKLMTLSNNRTNAKGKLTITIAPTKTTYYQVRWLPNSTDQAGYGEIAYRSAQIKVRPK